MSIHTLTDENRILVESLDKALGDAIDVDPKAKDPLPFDESLHQLQQELGVFSLLAASEDGWSFVDALRVAAILGKQKAPYHFYGTLLGCLVANSAGDAALLEAATEGKVALAYTGARNSGSLEWDASGGISLDSVPVLCAGQSRKLLVLCPEQGALAVDTSSVQFTETQTIDVTADFGRVSGSVSAPDINKLGGATTAQHWLTCFALLLTADAVGAAQAILDHAVAYVCEREQFGTVVGSFQGVQHSAATMAASLAPCMPLLVNLADALHNEGASSNSAAVWRARAHACEVARKVVKGATELQGGIAFTAEWGTHLWYKRAMFTSTLLGGVAHARQSAIQQDSKYARLLHDAVT